MTRLQSLLAASIVAATAIAFTSAASAQTVHVAAAGTSSQFLDAAVGADSLALNLITNKGLTGTSCPYHWTAKNSANLIDTRSNLIDPELGNVWIVWVAACSDSTGNTNVTDIWASISVDSTLAVRLFSAQETSGSGGQFQVIPAVTGNLISPQTLWPDGKTDVASLVNAPTVSSALGTSSAGGVHVNLAITDLRPEDALFVTKRALATLNTSTWTGLGYKGSNANVGAPIYTAQGTGTEATPVEFALSGGTDPISKLAVPAYTSIPVGAEPLVFVYNNGGTFSSDVANLITGVNGLGTKGGPYLAAHLFDGTTACDTHNPAFGGNGDGLGTPIALILREPISAAGSIAEYQVFRTTGNTDDSQEVGVINPFNSPYNPLNLACPTHGSRQRAIGTSEVVTAVQGKGAAGKANILGYIAFSFANASKLTGASFNYLTVDGVDPLSYPGTVNQELPSCAGPCPSSNWTGSLSYPNVRNGTYKLWALDRYLVYSSEIGVDPYGPDVLAQTAQDYVDVTDADFVPFYTTANGGDGLDVYRSHYKQENVAADNGAATPANTFDGGNTLGGGSEAGGDVAGLIEGPFGVPVDASGTVTTSGTTVTWKSGTKFVTGTAWDGITIAINGSNYTVSSVTSATKLVLTSSAGTNKTPVAYSLTYTSALATPPGTTGKKE